MVILVCGEDVVVEDKVADYKLDHTESKNLKADVINDQIVISDETAQ